jgi:hypothetical protein
MRKVQFVAVFWTLFLAIPLTALALSMAAYLTEHLGEILVSVQTISQTTSEGGRSWIIEFAARWPELAGMVIGQLVIMSILLITWRANKGENQSKI